MLNRALRRASPDRGWFAGMHVEDIEAAPHLVDVDALLDAAEVLAPVATREGRGDMLYRITAAGELRMNAAAVADQALRLLRDYEAPDAPPGGHDVSGQTDLAAATANERAPELSTPIGYEARVMARMLDALPARQREFVRLSLGLCWAHDDARGRWGSSAHHRALAEAGWTLGARATADVARRVFAAMGLPE